LAQPTLERRRLCPTRCGGTHSLIAHLITPATCLERQRSNYHKCFGCEYRGLPAEAELPELARATPPPPSEPAAPKAPAKHKKKPARAG